MIDNSKLSERKGRKAMGLRLKTTAARLPKHGNNMQIIMYIIHFGYMALIGFISVFLHFYCIISNSITHY